LQITGVFLILVYRFAFAWNSMSALPQASCGFVNRSVYCTRESNPHCGTDGVTYGNKCAFCKAVRSGGEIRLKHLGKC
uniref:Ovomucoid n=1 Tax=Malurus cyaneus samueli TaxID=2593467 RepID=A0A8C5UD68_9PASS